MKQILIIFLVFTSFFAKGQLTIYKDASARIEYWTGNEWTDEPIDETYYTLEMPNIDSTINYEFEDDWLVLVIKKEWSKASTDNKETTKVTEIVRKKIFKLPYQATLPKAIDHPALGVSTFSDMIIRTPGIIKK